MYCKKIKGLLFAILTIGATLTPSDSWSMVPENNNNGKILGGFNVPEEIFLTLFWNCLEPLEWVRVGKVCKYWHQISNDKNLWGNLNGLTLTPYNPQENQEKIQALTTLFQKVPSLQKLFEIDLSTTPLEALLPKTLENPTPASYKYYFISQYLEGLERLRTCFGQRYQPDLRQKEYMEKAYNQGSIKAGRKVKFREIIEIERKRLSGKSFHGPLNGTILEPTMKSYITGALLGSSKAQEMLGGVIVDHLIQHFWYKKSPPLFEQQHDALISFGNAWPGRVRNSILSKAYGDLGVKYLSLIDIGEGKQVDDCFGRSVTINWPEAFYVLGTYYSKMKRPDLPLNGILLWWPSWGEARDPKIYFEKAIEKKVRKSEIALAKYLEPTLENESRVRDILVNYPCSGAVLYKLGQILIKKIPNSGDGISEEGKEFLDFFRKACGLVRAKRRGLPLDVIGGGQHLLLQPSPLRAFVANLGTDLQNKNSATKIAFLDLVIEGPWYIQHWIGWMSHTITCYLKNKWGVDTFEELSTFLKKKENASLKNTWDERDTRYGFLQFGHLCKAIERRNFYSTVMNISLLKKEKGWFVDAFEEFCNSVSKGKKVGIGNFEFLRKSKQNFKKTFPQNDEENFQVESLFNTVPQPVQEPTHKRARPDDLTEIPPSPLKKFKKRDDDDFWDGVF